MCVEIRGRLQRAEKLTVGLADEHVRWQATVSTLDEKILNLIGDVFISAAARIGITPAALRSYMETARRQVVRELAKQGNLGVQTERLTNVRVRELLKDAELQKRVHTLLSNPGAVGSPIIRNAIDESINRAVKREARMQPRPVYFNEIMQNPELYNLTPGQLRTVNEINNVSENFKRI